MATDSALWSVLAGAWEQGRYVGETGDGAHLPPSGRDWHPANPYRGPAEAEDLDPGRTGNPDGPDPDDEWIDRLCRVFIAAGSPDVMAGNDSLRRGMRAVVREIQVGP